MSRCENRRCVSVDVGTIGGGPAVLICSRLLGTYMIMYRTSHLTKRECRRHHSPLGNLRYGQRNKRWVSVTHAHSQRACVHLCMHLRRLFFFHFIRSFVCSLSTLNEATHHRRLIPPSPLRGAPSFQRLNQSQACCCSAEEEAEPKAGSSCPSQGADNLGDNREEWDQEIPLASDLKGLCQRPHKASQQGCSSPSSHSCFMTCQSWLLRCD